MTSDSVRPPDKRYGYSNAVTGLVNLVKEEGVRGLARGLGANSVSEMYIYIRSTLITSLQVRAVLMNVSLLSSMFW